jgi:hypothetical protein
VIILNERHLKRLVPLYLQYYHEDRTHLGLGKDTPVRRASCDVGIAKWKQDHLVAATRRAPSPLRGSGLSHLWPRTATV